MNSQFQSYLDNDNYIILYFNKDCYYSYGFVNEYRNDIDFIINENNKNIIYTKEESLNVIKDYGIEIHFNKAIRSLEKFFDSEKDENMINLIFVDFNFFNTISISNVFSLFYGCCSLKSVDLSNFDTSKVTDMRWMFSKCSSLKSINLSSFDTSKVIYMGGMFSGCSSLKSIDLSNFDTSKVTDMGYMFSGCYSLEYIDLSKFDMINCNSYEKMFSDISSIRYINLYYLKNDKIISKTFDNIIEPIFVCQKDIIIDYPKAYNCCDSNFRAYNCISKATYFIPKIGFDIIFTVIFCCIIDCLCKKKAYPKKKTFVSNGIKPNIIEHDPQNDKDNPIKIIFQNPGIGYTSILIDSKETIDELIKFYFKACGRLDLYGDNTIFFLVNGKSIVQPYPKDFVETLKNKFVNSETIRICVNDSDDKMK